MGEIVHNCDIKQGIPKDGGGDVGIPVLAEKRLAEDTSHFSEDNKSSSKATDITDLQETDMGEMVHNCEIEQRIPIDGGGDVSIPVIAEKQPEENTSHFSEDNKSSSKATDITDLQETDMGEMVHNCEIKQRIPIDGGGDVSIPVIAEKQPEEDTSHFSEDNKSSSKATDITDLQETDMDEIAHNCQINLRIKNDNSGGDVSKAVVTDTVVDEVPSHYSEDNKSSCKESRFTELQKADMGEISENCELKQKDGNSDVSNAVLAEKPVEEDPSHYSEDNSPCSKQNKFTDIVEIDMGEISENCELKQKDGNSDVSNAVLAEKPVEEDPSHYSEDNSPCSKQNKFTDIVEIDMDEISENCELKQKDGNSDVSNAVLAEKPVEEDPSHYSEDNSPCSKQNKFTDILEIDMDEISENCELKEKDGNSDVSNAVLAEKPVEEDPSHYSEDNSPCSKQNKFTDIVEIDMDEISENCELKQKDGNSDVSNAVLAEKPVEEDPSHYSEDNSPCSKQNKFTDIVEIDMDEISENCELKQKDGNSDVSNAVLAEKPVEEDPSHYSEDNSPCSKQNKFTDIVEIDMDEISENCELKQKDGNSDVSNAVLAEKPVEEDPSHYSEDNSPCSKQNKFTDILEIDMDEISENCELKQKDGNSDVSNAVLAEKPVEEDPSHYSEDNSPCSKQNKFTDIVEIDMDEISENCELKEKDGNSDVSNAVLAEKPVEEDPSHYSEDNSPCSKQNKFTDIVEIGNGDVSFKHDAHVEDVTAGKNFQNCRHMDVDEGINVEHILSCLKSLQCPIVWKPDKEVEIHPRGEVPINLAHHLTEKEKGFICMETDLFREVTIYLVLAYHKYITKLPKEGLSDIYHCYDILLKAEKEIFNVAVDQANEDTKRSETNISNVSTSVTQAMEEDLNSPLANHEVLSVLCNNGNSSQDNGNDTENVLRETGAMKSSSVTGSSDNSRCINQSKADIENLVKNDVEDTELFAKLFETKTYCEWTNASTIEKNVFENWKTDSYHESCSPSTKLPVDKSERCLETHLCNCSETEKERKLQKLYALQCVTAASLAHYAFSFGCHQDVMKIMEYIEKLSKSLNSVGEAVIVALRGAVLCEYGYVGNKLALPLFKEALRLDPDNWEWNLYCAKVIGRLRRNEKTCNTEPSEEEIQMLKKAVELNPTNPSCLVHLANAYRTLAGAHYRQRLVAQAGSACDDPLLNSRLQRNWRTSRSSWRQEELWKQVPVTIEGNKEYLCMAKELYLEAMKYGRNCPYTNARCAKGLWSMPNPYKDKKLAQQTILHALCLAPDDSLVNHHAGMFYEYCHDYDKALICYEIATQRGKYNYPAEMNYINLRLKISAPGSYSPIFRLHGLLHKYNGVNHMVQTLCLRGYYHYEIEKILLLAIQNFAMAIELKPTSPILKDFYPGQMLKYYPESVNIYDLLEQILKDFEAHPEYSVNKDIVKYATDILKMGNEVRKETCASTTDS